MDGVADLISYGIDNGVEQSEEIQQLWTKYLNRRMSPRVIVGSLVQAKWSQEGAYNNFCPVIDQNASYWFYKRALTGCIATVMAQIMNYDQWPVTRTVEIPSYTTHSLKLDIPNIPEASYDWENMKTYYPINWSTSSTGVGVDAVAKLMYDCGVSVEMDYDQSSGAYTKDVLKALKTYFGYSKIS